MKQMELPKYVSYINEIREELLKDTDKQTIERCSDLDKFYGDNSLAKDVITKKYFAPWEKSPLDMWLRIAWGCAQVEKEEDRIYYAKQFLKILIDFYFIPGGRINYGLGREDIAVSFSNCYVLPIKDDSLDGIYNCLKEEALTYKRGGGCGHDLSILRPSGSEIKGTGGESCGPVGFMNLFSESTNTVAQNSRRGANMQTMLVSHPDIEKFINVKNDAQEAITALLKLRKDHPENSGEYKIITDLIERKRSVQFSNISVKLTDDFLKAVENNSDYNLTWNGKIFKTIKAKELWDKIIHNAWESGEPGLIFWDRMRETNNLEYKNPINCTNPCSEIPLGSYGNCLLGHMNLPKFVKNGEFDYDLFEYYIKIAMRFLDNVITLNVGRHALKEQNDVSMNERRTGLGVTGKGDMFVLMGVKYGSKQSLELTDKIGSALRDTAYDSSCDLAEERGAFPWFNGDGFFSSKFAQKLPEKIKLRIWDKGIRNGMLLTCAPVGTGSIICETSSGIEPIFRTSFTRKVKNPDGVTYKEYKVYHPLIQKLFPDGNIPEYVVDSTQITPEERISVQATMQKYIDNSISSTVNLPKESTEENVSRVYLSAWKMGCKGVTIYREGTREGVLVSEDVKYKAQPISKDDRIVPKRPAMLEGETYKLKIDLTGEKPYNTYITVNFEPGTKKPHEILVTETNSNKEFKDIVSMETTSRLVSLALRHGIPINFIVNQLEKVRCQYIYSLPVSIANILRNYIDYEDYDELSDEFVGEKCPSCGKNSIKREGICASCLDCGYSKCS